MTWIHTVLEIYEPEDGWPKEGTPAEWIAGNKVGYCNGRVDDLVMLTPLAKLLLWKLKYYIENLAQFLTGQFRKVEFDTEDWNNLEQ